MVFVHGGLLGCGRTSIDSASAAVVAHTTDIVVNDGLVVNVVNVGNVDIVHRAVVVESPVIPVSAFIPDAAVSKTIIDAAVEANVLTPVAVVPQVSVIVPTPVPGGPEIAGFGSHHPCAGHPEVAFVAISPIARRPDIAFGWRDRLGVNGQCRGSDRDRHAKLREGGCRQNDY